LSLHDLIKLAVAILLPPPRLPEAIHSVCSLGKSDSVSIVKAPFLGKLVLNLFSFLLEWSVLIYTSETFKFTLEFTLSSGTLSQERPQQRMDVQRDFRQ